MKELGKHVSHVVNPGDISEHSDLLDARFELAPRESSGPSTESLHGIGWSEGSTKFPNPPPHGLGTRGQVLPRFPLAIQLPSL